MSSWEESKAYQEWISQFSDQKKYRNNFRKWTEWIGIDPDAQLEMRREQLKSDDIKTQRYFEEKLKEYGKEIMKSGISKKTGQQYLIAVRSFFSHNYMDLKFKRGELKLEETKEVKASKKTKYVINNEELRALFTMCNPRDKPLLLILASTGMSPTDVSQLRIEGLRGLYDEEGKVTTTPVYGIKDREKTNIPQHFILGDEVLFYLEPILRERGYPNEGYMLITQQGNPYDRRSINRRMQQIAEKTLGEKGKDFQVKNLRDYFRNGLLLADINTEIQDAMLGWKRGGASQHYKISEVVIRQAYEKAKRHWSIDGSRKSAEDIRRLESRVGELVLKYEKRISFLEDQINTILKVINTISENIDPETKKANLQKITEELTGKRA